MKIQSRQNKAFSVRVRLFKSLTVAIAYSFLSNAAAEDLSGVLNLIQNAPSNSWLKMNTNSFSDVWAPLPSDGSYRDQSAIISAWSSFGWDSNRGDLLLFGGGHANYYGNEVYRWRGSTQQWERASLPSAIDFNTDMPVKGAEFAPQSSHTYDNSLFFPIADRFVTLGGAAQPSGGPFAALNPDGSLRRTGPYFFDPSKADPNKVGGPDGSGINPNSLGGNMWENRDIFTQPGLVTSNIGTANGTTDYAVIDGKEVIFYSGPNAGGSEHSLARLTIADFNDPSQDIWELLGVNYTGSGGKGAGAYDPVNNLYIKTYGGNTPFTFWNLDTAGPNNNNVLVNLVSAPSNFNLDGQYGMEYDPVRDRFLLWGGGGEVFQLDVGNKDGTGWVVTELATASSSLLPASEVFNGVLGKWHYAADLGVFVGLEGALDGNVWFYKPEGWTNAAPVPLLGGIPLMFSGLGFLAFIVRKNKSLLN